MSKVQIFFQIDWEETMSVLQVDFRQSYSMRLERILQILYFSGKNTQLDTTINCTKTRQTWSDLPSDERLKTYWKRNPDFFSIKFNTA